MTVDLVPIDELVAESWRLSPDTFMQRLEPLSYSRPPHVRVIGRFIRRIAMTPNGRGAIFVPPRSSKSQTGSIATPAWLLSLDPSKRILHSTYAKELGRDWGRYVRDLLIGNETDDDGRTVLGQVIAADSRAADRFETITRPGGMWMTGIGGVLTGRGADLGIIDDPVKNYQDAHSPTVRESTWQWYLSTWRTRFQPGASMLYIGTRWHQDDLAGRILANDTLNRWEVLSLPAIAERDEEWDLGNGEVWRRSEGDALWPEMYPVESYQELRAEGFSEYLWVALYQQRPAPPEGAIINRDWWRYWHEGDRDEADALMRPDDVRLPDTFDEELISVDCAFKAGDENDYVTMGYWGRSGVRRFLIDQVRARLTFTQTVDRLYQFHKAHPGATKIIVEDKANGPAVVNALKLKIPGIVERSPGQDSKMSRLMAVSGVIEAGNVILPRHAPWVGDYVEEHAAAPHGAHDDQIDQTTQALREWTPEAGRGKVRAVTARSDVQVPMSPTGRAPKPKGGMRSRRPGDR